MGCGELSHISVKYECSVSRVSLSVPSLLYCYWAFCVPRPRRAPPARCVRRESAVMSVTPPPPLQPERAPPPESRAGCDRVHTVFNFQAQITCIQIIKN